MDTVESTSIGPGLVAFLIVVALVVATGLLWYSMVRHLRKVPPTFDTEPDGQADASSPPSESATNDGDEPPTAAG